MKKKPVAPRSLAADPAAYSALFDAIKERVHRAQLRASHAANLELVALYWDIGSLILSRQADEGWGAKVIERLAADLRQAFPGRQGFSPRNLKYMRAFALAWPDARFGPETAMPDGGLIVQAPLAPSSEPPPKIVQAALAQLPWYHHIALLDKLGTEEERLWYAHQAVEHGWSRNVLVLQIVTPEAAGKMNFYLSAVDDRYRQPEDQPSMGLILCREKNRVLAEYALRDLRKPIGVSGYVTRLVDSLPGKLKGAVPTIAEIERGLSTRPRNPATKKTAPKRKQTPKTKGGKP